MNLFMRLFGGISYFLFGVFVLATGIMFLDNFVSWIGSYRVNMVLEIFPLIYLMGVLTAGGIFLYVAIKYLIMGITPEAYGDDIC